ncbi:hypothetical protein SGFS_101220 [Streptomyces graminofaciens]|uniref:Uncharacterized protein n=1 Tax=Streptomyces graminofaciens TaxID=68212 RepID=A0ABM7FNU4_9ACTN|nr:hypothetical protein [Streptomyces graminofaciens]BBC38828.1 hypothetical protein SGFS_101220 [Streptomyces graminofaciens]
MGGDGRRICAAADPRRSLRRGALRRGRPARFAQGAPGVREAFRTLRAERAPGTDAEQRPNELIASGRHVEDVYAAGRPLGNR